MLLRSEGFGSPSSRLGRAASSRWALRAQWFAARHAARDSDAWAPALLCSASERRHVLLHCLGHLGNPKLIPALSLHPRRRSRHLRPHQSTDYKVLRRKQPLCYSRRRPGTRYLVGVNINTNSSIKPAELLTPQLPVERNVCSSSRFVLVVCMFDGRVIPFAARLQRMNLRHATCFEHRSVLLRLALDVWSRFCSDATVDSTSQRPCAGPV